MEYRTKICPKCGKSFSYKIGKGKDRKYCGNDCLYQMRRLLANISRQNWDKCSVEGCSNTVRSKSASKCNRCYSNQLKESAELCSIHKCKNQGTRKGGICEMHYARIRRNGDLDLKKRMHRYKTGAGYIKLYNPTHPLSDSSGCVFEHRLIVLGEKEFHDCKWCGIKLHAKEAVIDHLNEKKDDNRPENLVVACNNCNRARGAIIPFIRGLIPESLELFIETVRAINGLKL